MDNPVSTPNEDSRFARLELLYGKEGVARLRSAHVLLIGVGGVGSHCFETMVRSGVGYITVIDGDEVVASNINRQAVALHANIGKRKVLAAKDLAKSICDDVTVFPVYEFLTPDNMEKIVLPIIEGYCEESIALPPVDFVIDAIDTVSSKICLAKMAQDHGFRLISSMGAAKRFSPEHIKYADIYKTTNCPLCKAIRTKARALGIKRLRVVYSDEQTVAQQEPQPIETFTGKQPLGSSSYMPAIFGQYLAADIIKAIVDSAYADKVYPLK
ncbi:MAG: tRNA threonylcarbamoyladenosine dehydratase [Eggerthellaceae bacterium]|nr:tRNA threonylcarbamoyladenosine dehydratase [Eggerthellaceae bacterium]